MSFMSALTAAWWKLREDWTFAGIVNAQRAAGSRNPVLDANRELFFRAEYIERFRDFATDRYMKGHDLKSSADAFIRKRLIASTTALSASDTAMVRAVIRNMTEAEAFHAEAFTKHRMDMQRGIDEAVAQAKRLYGPKGQSPYVTRVLRGRA